MPNSPSEQARLLETFWSRFGNRRASTLPHAQTMTILKFMASVHLIEKSPRTPDELKEEMHTPGRSPSFPPASPCFACHCSGELERHHLIQLSAGGDNDRDNLVLLCGECHSRLHPEREARRAVSENWTYRKYEKPKFEMGTERSKKRRARIGRRRRLEEMDDED